VGNEWWNGAYPTNTWFGRQNFFRYGTTGAIEFGTLRTIQMFEDIHNNSGVYNPSIFHFAMMGGPPGAVGDPRTPGSQNNIEIFGDTNVLTDALWPNAASKPWAYFDYGGWAPYSSAAAVFYTANFTTMVGNWCTAQATACAATPPFAPNCVGAVDTTYCLPFVNGIVGTVSADGDTVTDDRVFNSQFKQALYSVGKSFANYEGGGAWATCTTADNCGPGSDGLPNGSTPSTITTAAQRNYMITLYQSTSWAQAYSAYCQDRMSDTSAGGCGNLSHLRTPAVDFQFAFASPDLFGSTATEGNGLIPLWASETTINTGQP
jgi:hypothetical protein